MTVRRIARRLGCARLEPPDTAATSSGAEQQTSRHREDLWRAYDLAQRHYEIELQLFSTRMNLFLLIQSALVAVVGSTARTGSAGLVVNRPAIAAFGLALAVAWFVAAMGSYVWIKTWRAHMIQLSGCLKESTYIVVSHAHFKHKRRQETHESIYRDQLFWKQFEWLTWFIRPTFIICCLPLLFIGGWIYLGWFL